MPLAATHYHFIREIPMFASYEVRIGIQAWDHKWVRFFLFFLFLVYHVNYSCMSRSSS